MSTLNNCLLALCCITLWSCSSTEPADEAPAPEGTAPVSSPEVVAPEPRSEIVNYQANSFTDFRDGDIIFMNDPYPPAMAQTVATGDHWNHLGIIFNRRNGQTMVLESYGKVHPTPLADFLSRATDGQYEIMRLQDDEGLFNEQRMQGLQIVTRPLIDKPFDAHLNWSDENYYAAELVWKIFLRGLQLQLCEPDKLGDFNFETSPWPETMTQGYGFDIPLEDTAIKISSIYSSELLFSAFKTEIIP